MSCPCRLKMLSFLYSLPILTPRRRDRRRVTIPTPPLLNLFTLHSVCEQFSLRFGKQEGRKVNDHVSSFDLVCGTIPRVDQIKLWLLQWFEFFKTMDLLLSCPRDISFHYGEPSFKMAAENSNRSILKMYTSTRKNTFTLVTLPSFRQHFRVNIN